MKSWLANSGLVTILVVLGTAAAIAQDTIPPVEGGVRLGITYTPGMRPGMLVLGGPRTELLDSVRTIIQRDLDFSDQFEVITLPEGGHPLQSTLGVVVKVDHR